MEKYLSRQCPCCMKKTKIKESVSSKKRAEQCEFEELLPYWNGFFKDKIFFTYARCDECELLFAPIYYQPEQLEILYRQMAPNMDLVPISALSKTQRGYFNKLKEFSSLENGYIEIGPDIGIFTSNCSKEGKFDYFWLCEPNKEVANTLSKNMANCKYTIIEGMFGFSEIPPNSSSVAVMIQVLDHLIDPINTLVELKTKLRPNAKLLLVTHNEKSLLCKILGWKWPAFCMQHPQIYSPDSLTKLLENSGYKVESITNSKNYFQLSFLLKHILWAFGVKLNKIPSIFNFSIGLKLGNIITVATPK